MESWLWGVLLAPVVAFVLFGGVAFSLKWLIATYMADSPLKRALLAERIKSAYSQSNRRVLRHAARHPSRQP